VLKLDITTTVKKVLQSLDAKQFRQVMNKIIDLMSDPYPNDSIQLSGEKYRQFRRVDIGEYRIIYKIEDDCLKVPGVGKRNDGMVYRQIKRK